MDEKVRSVKVGELKELLEKGECVQLVDVRERSEFQSERLKKAVCVPLSVIEKEQQTIERDRTVYLMCQSGMRSEDAAKKLAGLGLTNLCVVEGGLSAWKRAGYASDTGAVRIWSLERQVRFAAGLLVLAGIVLGMGVHPGFFWLSAFVGAGLVFAAVTDTCGMAMLLARMPWNQGLKGSCKK